MASAPSDPGTVRGRLDAAGRLIAAGEPIDLDHTDDGTAYLGWAHAACNRRAAAIKGNKARRPPRKRVDMTDPCAIGIDIGHDREHTSAVFASQIDDGLVLIELTYIDGADVAHVIANLIASRVTGLDAHACTPFANRPFATT